MCHEIYIYEAVEACSKSFVQDLGIIEFLLEKDYFSMKEKVADGGRMSQLVISPGSFNSVSAFGKMFDDVT